MAAGKQSADNASTPETTAPVVGKGQATPRRKDREAANKRPLVPTDRKVAREQSRAATTEARNRARIGLAAGDERYLPARDRGPQRKFTRDFVDARYSFGELLVPFMILVIVFSFIPAAESLSVYVMWAFIALVAIDSLFLLISLRRRIETKFGKGTLERGVRWYAVMRGVQMRVMRMPKPQVARRQYPS